MNSRNRTALKFFRRDGFVAVLLFILAASVPNFAEIRFVDDAASQKDACSLQILQQDQDVLKLHFELRNVQKQIVPTDQGEFAVLRIGDEGSTQKVGEAQLPVIRRLIRIPQGKKLRVEIGEVKQSNMALRDIGLESPLRPVQSSLSKSKDIKDIKLEIDRAFYERDEFYPAQLVKTGEPFQLRNYNGILLEIYPVLYNPRQALLQLRSEIEITIHFEESGESVDPALARYSSATFERIARDIFVNDPPIAAGTINTPEHFVFIVADAFSEHPGFLEYVEWKEQKGFQVTVATVAELGGTAASIKQFIADLYADSAPPVYIILVGDTPAVPAWFGSYYLTDADYVQMDVNDYLPDILIGRFSATNDAELTAITEKALAYEKCDFPTTDWLNRALFIATNDNFTTNGYYNWQLVEATHNYVIDNFLTPGGMSATHIKAKSGGTTQDVSTALNAGQTLCNYSGHGITTEWQGPVFKTLNVNALSNTAQYPFVISNACWTGKYDFESIGNETPCLGEAWIRASQKGAFAFLGASHETFWEEDDLMERNMYRARFEDQAYSIGAMQLEGLMAVYSSQSTRKEIYFDIYNLLGDPSTMLWFGEPATPVVEHGDYFVVGAEDFAVTVLNEGQPVNGALVGLYSHGNLNGSAYSDASGVAYIRLVSPPTASGEMTVTVTGVDIRPYMAGIPIIDRALVRIEPREIPINKSGMLWIDIFETDGATPIPGVQVWLDAFGVDSSDYHAISDASGNVQFGLQAPYGEQIHVYGKIRGADQLLFQDSVSVSGGLELKNVAIHAMTPEAGLPDKLAPNLLTIFSYSGGEGALRFLRDETIDTVFSASEFQFVPRQTGTVEAAIAKAGYNIYRRSFPVQDVFGTLSGIVRDGFGCKVENAQIQAYTIDNPDQPVFSVFSNSRGYFEVTDDQKSGHYRFIIEKYGYQVLEQEQSLHYGANVWTFILSSSDHGRISGTLTDADDGSALDGRVRLSRQGDNGWTLFEQCYTFADSEGVFTPSIPYGNYRVSAEALGYSSREIDIAVTSPGISLDFHLEACSGNILVISDAPGKGGVGRSEKGKTPEKTLANIDEFSARLTADELSDMLLQLGYQVECESSVDSDPQRWLQYDLVISSSGSNKVALADAGFVLALREYAQTEGRLFIEGGEVAFRALRTPGYPGFAENVLHVKRWDFDDLGELRCNYDNHAIATTPFRLNSVLRLDDGDYGDQDVCVPMPDAVLLYRSGDFSGAGGIFVHNDALGGPQTVFCSFAFSKLQDGDTRRELLQNIVFNLVRARTLQPGDVTLDGRLDDSDVGQEVGFILHTGDAPTLKEYQCADVDENHRIDVLDLMWIMAEIYRSGSLAKTSSNQASHLEITRESEQIRCVADGTVAGLQLTLKGQGAAEDIRISGQNRFQSKISKVADQWIVLLYAEEGVLLSENEDIVLELPEQMQLLTATAADRDGQAIEVQIDVLPREFSLRQNFPNPFNPITTIAFEIPVENRLTIVIYDLLGQRVRVLADDIYQPGQYQVQWNGRNDSGRPLSSGLYFYVLQTPHQRIVRKMMFLK